MAKNYDKDLKFVFNAMIASLLIMAMLYGFTPPGLKPDPQQGKIDRYTQHIKLVSASEIAPLLHDRNGMPVMLMVYASWCGYCREMMPMVVQMMRDGDFDEVQPVFISRDTEIPALSAYLIHNHYDDLFTPYLLRTGESGAFRDMLRKAGTAYDSELPYTAFFDAKGNVVAQMPGMLDKDQLQWLAHSLQSPASPGRKHE